MSSAATCAVATVGDTRGAVGTDKDQHRMEPPVVEVRRVSLDAHATSVMDKREEVRR